VTQAKDITITLNDKEQQIMRGVFDLALKQAGLQALGAVQFLSSKMDAAMLDVKRVPTSPVTPEGSVVNDELLKKDDKKTGK
jgi:hypothetical protein